MHTLHIPLPIDDAELVDLEPFDVAGTILLEEGEIRYQKSELLEFWALDASGTKVRKLIPDCDHRMNALIQIRVKDSVYSVLLYSDTDSAFPPSVCIPYVISLFCQPEHFDRRSVVAIFCDEECSQLDAHLATVEYVIRYLVLPQRKWSLLSLARNFSINSDTLSSSGYGILIAEAYSSERLKHAYLDLFRCVEHRAIRAAKEVFDRDYTIDPKNASKELVNSLASEKMLYKLTLSTQTAVLAGASEVIDEIENSNRYMTALLRRERDLPSDHSERASAILYAVRNSIAHAKTGDLMIEVFPDYEAALERLVPYVEVAALRFAGIELDTALA